MIGSIPSWMLPYSQAPAGCNHRIQMTLKVQCFQPQYVAFTRAIRCLVTDAQYTCLEWASIYLNHLQQSQLSFSKYYLEAPKVLPCGIPDAILRLLSPSCFPGLFSLTSNPQPTPYHPQRPLQDRQPPRIPTS